MGFERVDELLLLSSPPPLRLVAGFVLISIKIDRFDRFVGFVGASDGVQTFLTRPDLHTIPL